MNKIFGLIASVVCFTVISCSSQTETKPDVIIAPAPVEKKEPVVVIRDTPATSIVLDKKGVKVKTKKVNVEIKPQ